MDYEELLPILSMNDREYEPRRSNHTEEYQGNVSRYNVTASNQQKQTSYQQKKPSDNTRVLKTQEKLSTVTSYNTYLQGKNDDKEGAGMIEDRFTENDPVNYQGLNNLYNYSATNSIGLTKADEYQRDIRAPVHRKTAASIKGNGTQSGYSGASGSKNTHGNSQDQVHDVNDSFGTESSRIASNNEGDIISRLERKEKQQMELLINQLQLEKERLKRENLEKESRLKKLAEQMDHMIEIGGNFEDVNDEISCSNITKECIRLNKDWANLSRNIIKSSIPELDAIHALSELMKFCYYKCRTTADRQIRQFWLLNDTENVPQHPHLPRILHLRKCTSKEDCVREKIKKNVFTELCQAHADTFKRICTKGLADKVKDSMEQFFHKYIDCCWLMAISYPPIILNFEVVGKLYVDLLTERWSEYSMNDPVEDMEKPSGTIVEVAWPCVERQDGSGFYAKGEVVILRRVDNKSDE